MNNIANNFNPPKEDIDNLIYLYKNTRYQDVLDKFEKMVLQYPHSIFLYNLSGSANALLKRFDKAVECYNKALRVKPDYAAAYNNLGNVFKEKGDKELAIRNYKLAIKLKPNYAEYHNNIGIIYKENNSINFAKQSFKQAISLKSDYAEAYYGLGLALEKNGEFPSAIKSYESALIYKPNYPEVFFNLGNIYTKKGDYELSFKNYVNAIKLKKNYYEAYFNLSLSLFDLKFTKYDREVEKVIFFLLNQKTIVRPTDIGLAVISIIKLNPCLSKELDEVSRSYNSESLLETILKLSKLSLLLKYMSLAPIPDLGLEAFLSKVRESLLFLNSELGDSQEVVKFQSILALHCFINEYIYYDNNKQIKALKELENLVLSELHSGRQPSPNAILALASFKALNQFKWHKKIKVTKHIEKVFKQQVIEPNYELKLKSTIPILGKIKNQISRKVREQYESHPYPRWINFSLSSESKLISEVTKTLKLNLIDFKINDVKKPDILIAGCGTGQHSIETAVRFRDSKVLAVDLSLASLAYAKRKTEEYKVKNIEYMQADILNLGKFKKKFDIVESCGVLHHMDDPLAGWRILTDSLKQGGLMKIGLYSELARECIKKIRKDINKKGVGSSEMEIKAFRNDLIYSTKKYYKPILDSDDFYCISTVRDLLFHEKEHNFTIPQIKDFIYELGLKFCGFQGEEILKNFNLINTNPKDIYDLDKWNLYEESYPMTFVGMYEFWCQKA